MPTTLTYIMILILLADFLFEEVLDKRNHKRWSLPIPSALSDLYKADEYQKAKDYHNANRKTAKISGYLQTLIILSILYFCLFGQLQNWIATLTDSPYYQAYLFFAIYGLGSFIISLPFSIYNTFVIEENFGFNKTTGKTFILDIMKSTVVGILIGGLLLTAIIAFYYFDEKNFWIYAWILFATFSIFMAMFYTSWIVPIFNKLTPLSDGELKEKLTDLGQRTGFPLHEVYVIDGSKRSSKANAYFSGLGSKKTIVLYDTLIEQLSIDEVVAVMAHEIGHYKRNHVIKSLTISLLQMGVLLWILSLCVSLPAFHLALGSDAPAFHIGLIAFSLLYSPIGLLTGVGMNILSRKNEYEADAYAKIWSSAPALVSGLKKLHKDTLSNVNPDPLNVFVHYSHPTLLQRIQALTK
ncbi:MAG: M48 family metallopeptidase [Chitinophagales bacterium]|nr:M48 family metallopeptidase [Chitinophagales bacterium]